MNELMMKLGCKMDQLKWKAQDKLRDFLMQEDGMGTVEMILIIVVLIALVALFSKQLKSLVTEILGNITKDAKAI